MRRADAGLTSSGCCLEPQNLTQRHRDGGERREQGSRARAPRKHLDSWHQHHPDAPQSDLRASFPAAEPDHFPLPTDRRQKRGSEGLRGPQWGLREAEQGPAGGEKPPRLSRDLGQPCGCCLESCSQPWEDGPAQRPGTAWGLQGPLTGFEENGAEARDTCLQEEKALTGAEVSPRSREGAGRLPA